jgi:hypothetical protein
MVAKRNGRFFFNLFNADYWPAAKFTIACRGTLPAMTEAGIKRVEQLVEFRQRGGALAPLQA